MRFEIEYAPAAEVPRETTNQTESHRTLTACMHGEASRTLVSQIVVCVCVLRYGNLKQVTKTQTGPPRSARKSVPGLEEMEEKHNACTQKRTYLLPTNDPNDRNHELYGSRK